MQKGIAYLLEQVSSSFRFSVVFDYVRFCEFATDEFAFKAWMSRVVLSGTKCYVASKTSVVKSLICLEVKRALTLRKGVDLFQTATHHSPRTNREALIGTTAGELWKGDGSVCFV